MKTFCRILAVILMLTMVVGCAESAEESFDLNFSSSEGGVSADFGFSEANYDIAEIKKQMLLNSALKIMVFDETKVGVAKAFQTCPLTDVDIVITMKGIDPKIKRELEAAGKTVIECAPPSSKAD